MVRLLKIRPSATVFVAQASRLHLKNSRQDTFGNFIIESEAPLRSTAAPKG